MSRLLNATIAVLFMCRAFLAADVDRANSAPESPASAIDVFPESIVLHGKDSRQQIAVRQHDIQRPGDTRQPATFHGFDTQVVSVSLTGLVTPTGNGTTKIEVRFGGQRKRITVETKDANRYLPIDFANDIVPILTRRGCNTGACHGKSTGRGGFRLSLFGFIPEQDYEWITKGARGRRVFPSSPSQSLFLMKPTMAVPHGGGHRLKVGEPEYQRIERWIAANSPKSTPDAKKLDHLDVFPTAAILRPNDRQQLVATAVYSDGSRRDVTSIAEFRVNETSIASIDDTGLVTTQDRTGETPIIALLQGRVAVSQIVIPLNKPEPDLASFPIRGFIDRHVSKKLKQLRVAPSAVANDGSFLRRSTLQIAGRLPTVDETRSFIADQDSSKREFLIQRLVSSGDFADNFAQKWSDILRNKRRAQKDRIPGTIAFHRWIRNAIAANMPYDQFVREILTATGNVSVHPPAQWYAEVRYLDRYVDDTAQVLLGTRIGCARCHHHPFEDITQEDYYGLAAFFVRVDRKGGAGVAERRANEAVLIKPTGDVKHPVTGKIVPPHGLGAESVDVPRYGDPRSKLVDWMAEPDNPYFARAFVNRLWAHFFGRGLVEPLDDMRVTNPASIEPLLEELAQEFIRSKFDRRHIVELICNSTTYQLSSLPNDDNLDETTNHSRFYPQRLQAEVLLDAIDAVTESPTRYSGLPNGTRSVQLPDENYSNKFLTLFGRPPRESACECERSPAPSLSQSLFVMNDQFILGKTASGSGYAARLAKDKREHHEKVTELFIKAFSRTPTKTEFSDALEYIQSESNTKTAYSNLVWTIINTKEFMYNH